MNNKKLKRLISFICTGSLLLGTIPTNGIVASAAASENGVTFFDTAGNKMEDAKYSLHGVSYDADEGIFVRMPLEEATKICGKDSVYNTKGAWTLSIYSLAREASGGRIRFNTNSSTITIEAELYHWDAEHVAHGGKSMAGAKYGFDIYEDTADGSTYVDTVVAETKDEDGDGNVDPGSVYINQTITLGDAKDRDLTLYFPVVTETRNVKITVAEGSTVKEHVNDYDGNGRIVVYGNSITQGGCATKPGSTYVNTVARNVNKDLLNLGVWGSCKGQPAFAEYIASIDDMSMLIIDYDGNQSLASALEETHYSFYEIVRAAHPDIPIIVLTRASNRMQVSNAGYPDEYSTTEEMKAVIRQTYETAKAAGDKNIHFVDGETYFGYSKTYMADNAHPDAIGQAKMADVVTATVKEVLAGAENLCVEPSSCKEPTSVLAKDFTGEENGTKEPEGWNLATKNILDGSLNSYVITNEDDNQEYQMKFTKGTSGARVTLSPTTKVWNGEMNLGVELDAELHIIDDVIPSFGVKIGEAPNNSADQKYEVRVEVTEENYTVSFWDGTPGESNPTKAAKKTSVVDQNFIQMYQAGKVSFNLRINQTLTKRDGVDVLALDVYINDMLVAGYNLKPQEGFEPNSFKIFCYGAGEENTSVNKAVVDNIKAYVTTTHQLNLVATEGTKEHYVCSECGKKYKDDKGIIQVTDAQLEGNGVTFSDTAGNQLEDAKYSLHGVSYDNDEGIFVRMDLEAAANICNKDSVYDDNGEWVKSIYSLARESSGGRIRFNTNSPTITIKAELFNWDASHVSHGGKMEAAKYGFDIYEDTADGSTYVDTVAAETKDTDEDGKIDPGSVYVNQTINLGDAQERNITIYFPVIIETKRVEICVAEGSTVQEHKNGYEGNGRVVFYGNSITQGGSAVKPGSNYVNASMRNLNLDFLNLGMWGSCKGQATFAEYIANLDNVSMLVMDYDGNENKASELEARHYPFYKAVREKYPDIPIVLLTRSGNRLQVRNTEDSRYSTTAELREVIRQTYEKAKAEGDENIHYVDGETFFGFSYAYLADGVHPTTTGQEKMAEVLTVVLEEVLAGAKNLCVEPNSCKEPTTVLTKDFTGEEDGTVQPDGWKASKQKILEGSLDCGVITTENDNKAYQLKYTRGTSGAVATLTPENTVWNGEMNLAVEMDVELHVTDGVIPQLGVKIGEEQNNSANQKYEVRIQVAETKQAIYIYDNTGGSNSASELVITDTFKNKNFIDMYQEGKVAFNLKITQTKVQHRGVDSLELNVYLDSILVSGYNLIPQEGFEPNSFKIFCYGAGDDGVGVNKAVVDNIQAYVTTTHQLSHVVTEGMREHYVCNECGKKFLDEKGILQVTDEDLIITNDCMEMLFSEDFEGADSWKLNEKYTGTDPVGIVAVDDGHAYQLGVTRESKAQNTYITKSSPALATAEKYTIQFESTLYRGTLDDGTSAGNRWPTLTFMMYDTSTTGYFEIRIIPKSTGFQTYLKEKQGSDSYDHSTTTVEDSTLAVSSSKTEVSYDVRIDVTTYKDDNNNTRWQFLLYVGDNDAVPFDFEPYYEGIAINQLRFYTYPSTVNQTTHFKTQIDNIMIYTDSHTLSPVEATPSTSDKAGQRAHYACEVCGKKFADSKGEQAVTDAQLAYAKLTDILCQTKPNDNNSDNTDIRFVVYVDDYQKYQNVTFKITCSAGTGTAVCKDVYTGVYAGGVLYTTEDIYGVDGYFATFILKNNSQTDLEDTMSVVATWTAIDGTETTKTRIVNISEEQE